MLWISLALLTAVVVLALARPLMRPATEAAGEAEAGFAVYRDQLAEIESDRDRGLIGGAEADAARAEVGRRLLQLKAPDQAKAAGQSGSGSQRLPSLRIMQGVLATIPLAGVALYIALGSPNLSGQPLAERQAAPTANSPVSELVARVEAELKKNPEDARGWSVIAPVYMRLNRYDDAAHAYSQVLRINGEAVEPLLGFAQAALLANKGIVNDNVKRAAERIQVLQPGRIEPQIWMALAKEQDGDIAGAIAAFKALVASAPEGAAWVGAVKEQLLKLEGGAAAPAEGAASPPMVRPSAEAIAALPAGEQQKQIAAMVDGLAQRLKQNGNDLPGWLRLVRAYQVMARKDDAVAALASARKQFASDAKALADLDSLARDLGL